LAAVFDCTAVIVTEEKLFDYVRAHPTTRKLERICPVELVPLDDLVSDPWQYGMTLAYRHYGRSTRIPQAWLRPAREAALDSLASRRRRFVLT
jgi:hypothetical protein